MIKQLIDTMVKKVTSGVPTAAVSLTEGIKVSESHSLRLHLYEMKTTTRRRRTSTAKAGSLGGSMSTRRRQARGWARGSVMGAG